MKTQASGISNSPPATSRRRRIRIEASPVVRRAACHAVALGELRPPMAHNQRPPRSPSGCISEETGQDASDQFRVAVSVDRGCWWPGEQLAEPRVLA
jgi:hypothetical protein